MGRLFYKQHHAIAFNYGLCLCIKYKSRIEYKTEKQYKLILHSDKGYRHEKATKEEHEDKIRCSASKRSLLQHTTIPVSAILELKTSWA